MNIRSFVLGMAIVASLLAPLPVFAVDATPVQIVAIGTSNTFGLGVSPDQAYPAQLQEMLRARGYNVSIANAGVTGNTTEQILARIEDAAPDGTKIAILQPGTNDFLQANRNGTSVDLVAYHANVQAMVEKLNARRIAVIIVGFKGPYVGAAPGAMRCGGMFQTIHGSQIQSDGMHLTPDGYHSVATMILPCVQRLLPKIRT